MAAFCYICGMKIDLEKIMYRELRSGLDLVKAISDLGYETCIAGGCVREFIRHYHRQVDILDIHDIDIATAAPISVLKEHFRTESNNGEKHGTILVFQDGIPFEVTHFRADGEYSDGRHPDSVELVSTFREDAARRDFTINAMGMTWDGEILDYYGGAEDVGNKTIRTVGNPVDRFREDSLRIIRGIRFAMNLGYIITEETIEGMTNCSGYLKNVANERIRDEFLKLNKLNDDGLYDFMRIVARVGAVHSIKAFRDISYVTIMKLRSLKHLTRKNLFPAIAALLGYNADLEGFVPTREERKLYGWYTSYKWLFNPGAVPERDVFWTTLVDMASGDYATLFDMYLASAAELPWLEFAFPKAIYIAKTKNKPAMTWYTKRVQDMGIQPGKEFGIKVRELIEEEYGKIAESIPSEQKVMNQGENVKLVYRLVGVEEC